jgi:hypothetical protein
MWQQGSHYHLFLWYQGGKLSSFAHIKKIGKLISELGKSICDSNSCALADEGPWGRYLASCRFDAEKEMRIDQS